MPTNEDPSSPGQNRITGRRPIYGGGRIVGALFLIGLGIALFLDNIGILHFEDIWRYWPVYLVAVGIGKATSDRSAQDRSWGVMLIVAGALFLGWNLGILHLRGSGFNWAAGLVLVGFGLRSLMEALHPGSTGMWGRRRRGIATDTASSANAGDFEPVISSLAIFASSKRRIENPTFRGGDVQAIFGSVEFDLRLASIPPGTNATIDVQSIFGSVKMRVPYHWRVSLQVQGVMGSAEDKTVPDPRSTQAGPLLVITGTYLFGSVEIEN